MHILSHRGLWSRRSEANTMEAFERAFRAGFGVEVDVRDSAGRLVISHDMPGPRSVPFVELLKRWARIAPPPMLAINVKADGVDDILSALLRRYAVKDHFLFDLSGPSAYAVAKKHKDLILATRQSDIEKNPVLYRESRWVWMDELGHGWIDNRSIERHVHRGKRVSIVSPELHGRPYARTWARYRQLPERIAKKVYLCTDHPLDADGFFNGR